MQKGAEACQQRKKRNIIQKKKKKKKKTEIWINASWGRNGELNFTFEQKKINCRILVPKLFK